MKTKAQLDEVSKAIEAAITELSGSLPRRKRMALGDFIDHALGHIKKVAEDEPAIAARRLAAVKRSVDDVRAQLVKLSAEDLESESIQVEVLTAWAPSKAEGDQAMEDLTTYGEQASEEEAVGAREQELGDTNFAQNLAEATKALKQLRKELEDEEEEDDKEDPEGKGKGKRRPAAKAEEGGWPLDLNTSDFRQGVAKGEGEPTWGRDPDEVAKL